MQSRLSSLKRSKDSLKKMDGDRYAVGVLISDVTQEEIFNPMGIVFMLQMIFFCFHAAATLLVIEDEFQFFIKGRQQIKFDVFGQMIDGY